MTATPCSGFRARRLALCWTIQQTSQLSGVSPYIIRCCEDGNFAHISMQRLIALAACLGISVDEGCRTRIPTGTVLVPVGLIAAVFSIAGHYLGAGLTIKNGSKAVRPVILVVLALLLLEIALELTGI